MGASHDLMPLLARLEQAIADTRSMAATIGRALPVASWDPEFRDTWLDLLARTGAAVSDADAHALAHVRADLLAVAGERFGDEAGSASRPAQGALLVNLRNILEAMDAVAEAQPVSVGPPPVVLTR